MLRGQKPDSEEKLEAIPAERAPEAAEMMTFLTEDASGAAELNPVFAAKG